MLNGTPARPHYGIDLATPAGSPIRAPADGLVTLARSGMHFEGGLTLIDHGQGLITRYAHGRALHVQAGEIVKRGQEIAEVGTTGRSTGPHLHFEVLLQGVPQNPARFLANAPAPLVAAHASAVRDPRRR